MCAEADFETEVREVEIVVDVPRAPRPDPLLDVKGLTVTYAGAARAVDSLSFRVGRGEVVALIGPNGAGKTSTLRSLSGFLPGDRAHRTAGSITFDGAALGNQAPYRTARQGIALIPEREKIFGTLSVADNLKLGARANRSPESLRQQRELVDQLFPVLRQRQRQVSGYLSGGERQMLAIASAMLSGPRLLMVDELSLGLAPKVVRELLQVLRRLNRERGLSILLVEQSAEVAFAIAHYVYVLNVGRSVLEGHPRDLRRDAGFRDAYLGLTMPAPGG
jgi:branched-chain amino acid transport system ATP-binding protein